MKRGFVIILVLMVLLQSSIKTLYVAYFQINQEYIESVLCVNKDKPSSSCHGKCFLEKKMNDQAKHEQTIPSVLKGLDEVVLYCISYYLNFNPTLVEINSIALVDTYQFSIYASPTDLLIQPPQ